MTVRYLVLGVPKEDVCSVANYFSKSNISYFVLIGYHGIFQDPASFDTSLILCGIRLDFKFKKQPFCVFRCSCDISSFFVKTLSFRVFFSFFLLNSIEEKDFFYRQFHFMAPVAFLVRIQI